MDNLDTYLMLTLRAQSLRTATWEALAAIKTPPVMDYVRQGNIGMASSSSTRDSRAGWCPVPGREPESTKHTTAEKRWRTVGPRSAGHARPS